MTFTFVHTADWQIGKRFGAFPEEKASVLRHARLDAIDRIAEAAREAGARHVLVAGDVWDKELLEPATLHAPLERMRRHASLAWHLLPGNHDPARPGGLWEPLLAEGLPENVAAHVTAEPRALTEGVWLLPAPLTARAIAHDPTAWMDEADLPQDALRIGLAHGSVQGFGSSAGDEAGRGAGIIAPDRPARAGLAYLALGDWHGRCEISERCWYSGTPEPDRFPDNEPGFALVVRLEGGTAPPEVTPVRTAAFTWARRAAHIAGAGELAALEAEIRALAERPDRLLLSLSLAGVVSLADHARLRRWAARLEPALFHLDCRMADLLLRPDAADLDRLGETGELRAVGEHLMAMAAEAGGSGSGKADGEEAPVRPAVAAAALARLMAFAEAEAEAETGPCQSGAPPDDEDGADAEAVR